MGHCGLNNPWRQTCGRLEIPNDPLCDVGQQDVKMVLANNSKFGKTVLVFLACMYVSDHIHENVCIVLSF